MHNEDQTGSKAQAIKLMKIKSMDNQIRQQTQISLYKRMQLLHIKNTDMTSMVNDSSMLTTQKKINKDAFQIQYMNEDETLNNR